MPTLTVVVASTRPGRAGPAVADWIVPIARAHGGFAVGFVSYGLSAARRNAAQLTKQIVTALRMMPATTAALR